MPWYSQRITIGSHQHELRLPFDAVPRDEYLPHTWRQIAGADTLYAQQIGVKPTFLGVVYSECQHAFFRRFLRVLLCSGVAWDILVSHHVLVDIRNDSVKVYYRSCGSTHGRIVREIERLVRDVRVSMSDDQWQQQERVRRITEVCDIPFFCEHLTERHMSLVMLLRDVTSPFAKALITSHTDPVSGAMIVVAGMIDQPDADRLLGVVRGTLPGDNGFSVLVQGAGHVLIVIDETGHHVYAQTEEHARRHEIERRIQAYLEGFLSVLVISDTQLGANSTRDFFGPIKEQELIALLRWVIAHDAMVIINGDFLGLDLKRENSIDAVAATYHELFLALKHVRRLVYVAGNHDGDVISAACGQCVRKHIPHVEIMPYYHLHRQEMFLHFEHGHIQTGVYRKWYTHMLFWMIDAAHDLCEGVKRIVAGDQTRYPGTHLLYYLTKFLVSIPCIRMWPIKFFTVRDVARALAVSQALNEGVNAKRLTVVCCGHIHNRIEAGRGWTNAFLQRMLPYTAYVNTGAWNASILQDRLFKEEVQPEAHKRTFFDHDAPLVKRDWLCVTSRGQLVMGSGAKEFTAKMCQASVPVDLSHEN